MSIQFTDICFVTNDVIRLRTFYEIVFGSKGEGDELHSTLQVGGLGMVFLLEKNSDLLKCRKKTGKWLCGKHYH